MLGWAFQPPSRAFEGFRENQKLDRLFEKHDQVFKKLGHVFVLQHGPCCPNQPRYNSGPVIMKISTV